MTPFEKLYFVRPPTSSPYSYTFLEKKNWKKTFEITLLNMILALKIHDPRFEKFISCGHMLVSSLMPSHGPDSENTEKNFEI